MNIVDQKMLPVTLITVGIIIFMLGWFFIPDDHNNQTENSPQQTGNNDANTQQQDILTPDNPEENSSPAVEQLPRMRFAGQVIDVSTGLPVLGATVAFRNASGSTPLGHARTRTGGLFAVDLPETERALVTVRAPGFATGRWQWGYEDLPDSEATTSSHPEELMLAVSPESVLWVALDSSESEQPERPFVEVRMLQARTARELGESVEGPPQKLIDGELRIGGLLSGRHLVSIRDGSRVLARREVEIGEGEERELLFRLGPSIRIYGWVLRNDIPVDGGTIQTWCRETQASSSVPVALDGHFETLLPGPGQWRFIWTSGENNGEGTTHQQYLTEDTELVIELLTGSLDGQVVGPGGEPLVGLQGSLFGPRPFSFTTDDHGRFFIDEIPHGRYRWVFLQQPEGVFAPSSHFDISGKTSETFQFSGACRLIVEVQKTTDEYRKPEVATVPVYRIDQNGALSPLKRTEHPNEFWWPRQGGLGVVYQRGWTPYFFSTNPVDHPVPVEALLQPAGEVTVTLVGNDGEVVPDHPFTIEPLAAPQIPQAWAKRATGPRGSCRVTLAPGEYKISTVLDGGASSATILIFPQQSTRLRLP
ncbi:MAG: carboxypeptidase-like regulatory domain-containing protein [Planctomycetota bacterium]|nr:carboxypeptidase-like regulatory domain-containing protein [Planctomycetota bacterium]